MADSPTPSELNELAGGAVDPSNIMNVFQYCYPHLFATKPTYMTNSGPELLGDASATGPDYESPGLTCSSSSSGSVHSSYSPTGPAPDYGYMHSPPLPPVAHTVSHVTYSPALGSSSLPTSPFHPHVPFPPIEGGFDARTLSTFRSSSFHRDHISHLPFPPIEGGFDARTLPTFRSTRYSFDHTYTPPLAAMQTGLAYSDSAYSPAVSDSDYTVQRSPAYSVPRSPQSPESQISVHSNGSSNSLVSTWSEMLRDEMGHEEINTRPNHGTCFYKARDLPCKYPGYVILQGLYIPPTRRDQDRYVRGVKLLPSIEFWTQNGTCGVLVKDLLASESKTTALDLVDQDGAVLEEAGQSISIRLQWPGYQSWSKQVATKDFRKTRQPISRRKIAQVVAKKIKMFFDDVYAGSVSEDLRPAYWNPPKPVSASNCKVGHDVRLEDIVLVSLHHVSRGSWQPTLRVYEPVQYPMLDTPFYN